jgi:hypothetical protein
MPPSAVQTRRESTSRLDAVNNHHHHHHQQQLHQNNYHYHQQHSSQTSLQSLPPPSPLSPHHQHLHQHQRHPIINRSNSHVTEVESFRSSTPTNYLGIPNDGPLGVGRIRRNSTHSMHSAAMLPPPCPSSSGNFLEPNCRRSRLLPTLPPGSAGRLSPMTIRRASSPRMLPTPPPNSSNPGSTPPSPHFSSASPSPPCIEGGGYLERRPSSGRRLPPEPPSPRTPPIQHSNSLSTPFGALSTMSATTSSSSSSQINHQLSSPNLLQKSPSRNAFHKLPPLPSESSVSISSQNRLIPEPISVPSITNGIIPKSAPQSPRSPKNDPTQQGPSPQRARKFSDVRDLAMARNGSMAAVLEQQHILREEFISTPDSAMVASASDHSSIYPSSEQLNCGESTKSSSDGDDPSVHGLDPSLYVTGSASSYSVTDVAPTTNGGSIAALNGGNHETSAVSTSNSWPENEPRPKGLGLIHCTLQHFPIRKRLRVSILKIEGLAGELKPELEIQPFCKIQIVPGKHGKQQQSVVKRGRDAVFNAEFFFDNLTTEELDLKTLQIEVLHQSNQKLQKDMEIGEISVPLKDLTQLHTKKEVRIVEELKFKTNAKKVGKISIATSIEKKVLTVTINKVDDLPKWGIIGAPDVCVRVKVVQEGAKDTVQVKHSRVIKSTCSAVYKEGISFLINEKPANLAKTQVTVSVHDTSRSATGDDIIGSVFLGPHSIDKSEIEHWKNTVEHIGKEYKGTFSLKPPSNHNPDVHVSETHSDSEE